MGFLRTALVGSKARVRTPATGLLLAALTLSTVAQEHDRTKIPDRYKWNLSDIYPTDAAWRAAKDKLASELPQLGQYKGKLVSSARTLADALEKESVFSKEFRRLSGYASMLADQDTRDSNHQGMDQEMSQLAAAFGAEVSYLEPEILKADRSVIQRHMTSEPRLEVYRFYLDDIARRAQHTLSDAEERILAGLGPVAGVPGSVFTILSNADFPYPTVTLSDGRSVTITQAAFNELRALPTRADREKVMSAYFNSLGAFSRTLGTTMNGQVQRMLFASKTRKYASALEMTLDSPNIPTSVYKQLIDGINRNLPSFHRYLRLRKRMLGLDDLHYYDLYAPLVASVTLKYSPEEAQKHVLGAVAPLGPEYQAVIQRAFNERWIDLLPSDGKLAGAYSTGAAFDVHPYMLLNYNGLYLDLGTLAHELGHAMHSFLTSKAQPYARSGYPTFVAEVASTFNESLLLDYMLARIPGEDSRLSLLGSYVENVRQTVFRQSQFAEFEFRAHEMGQKGQPVTGDALSKLYMEITKKYYGHDQGICRVDDYVANEWSFVPHFYQSFYVFQYATSFTASSALAAKVKAGDPEARRRYLSFLSAGGSKYPIELLKDAGVDMTTDEPLELTMKEMNRAMDEMERLLAKLPATGNR